MTDTPELKPCPMCGEPPELNLDSSVNWSVQCKNWECGSKSYGSKDFVINKWNCRPAPEPAKDVEGLIERLEKAKHEFSRWTSTHDHYAWLTDLVDDSLTALQSQASADQIIAELVEALQQIKKETGYVPGGNMDYGPNVANRVSKIADDAIKAWREAG